MRIIDINDGKKRLGRKPQGRQTAGFKRNPANLGVRRSFVRMFLVGTSVRRVARHHRVEEAVVEQEIREVIFNPPASLWREAA